MTINYGKRNGGALTAASPGDTLYIPLNFYNDSGASISIGNTLVAGDIEVFKNGSVTQRATDSGYAVLGDTGNFDNRIGFKMVSISLYNTADDASFYAVGSSYQVAIDSVTVDGRTVRFWPAVFEIGEPRANLVQVGGDTGAANYLRTTFANGFADTGINDNLGRIRSDVDTGLRVHIDDSDTGIKDVIADLDTGLRALIALQDTGFTANAVWNALRSQHTVSGSFGESDTGVNQRFGQIQSDVDTGLRAHINDLDTGLHDTLADYDTGVRALLALQDTGAVTNAVWNATVRGITNVGDTGIVNSLAIIRADTDTGIQSSVNVTGFADTGMNDRLARILADTDTGLKTVPTAIKAKTDSLTFTVAGQVDANIQYVNDVAVAGTGASGDEWGPA